VGTIVDTLTAFKNSLAGGSFETLAAATGDSLSIRWFGDGTRAQLLEAWVGDSASKCQVSIRSPLLHDNVRGMRFGFMANPTLSATSGKPQALLAPYWKQPYQPTDTLIVEANGTAADRVVFSQLIHYDAPQYSGGRFIGAPEIEARFQNLVGILVAPTGGATGDYGAVVGLASSDDRLKANTDYALVGATSDLMYTTAAIVGPDTGNFPVSWPGSWQEDIQAGWFYEMSRRWNMALCPIINANNKGNTNIKLADAGGAVAPNIVLQFVELS
jgi:hypothetical protein